MSHPIPGLDIPIPFPADVADLINRVPEEMPPDVAEAADRHMARAARYAAIAAVVAAMLSRHKLTYSEERVVMAFATAMRDAERKIR